MVKKILLKFWVDLNTYEKLVLKKGAEKDWQNFLQEIVTNFLNQKTNVEKLAKKIEPEIYAINYNGQKVEVANIIREENMITYKPKIKIEASLWYNFLEKRAKDLGIIASAEIESDLVKEIYVQDSPDVDVKNKESFKKSIDWVFRTALEKGKNV